MRLQRKGTPNPGDCGLAHPHMPGHSTSTPVSCTLGFALQGLRDHPLHIFVADLSRCSWTRFIEQAIDSYSAKTATPTPNGYACCPQPLRNFHIIQSVNAEQNDPCPSR